MISLGNLGILENKIRCTTRSKTAPNDNIETSRLFDVLKGIDMAENIVAQALQQGLVDLIELSLQAKEAHWNITGKGFQTLHELLDTVVDETRLAYDEFAERLASLGEVASGRSQDIVASTTLDEIPNGQISVADGYKLIEKALMKTSETMKGYIRDVDEVDPLSSDLLISTARDLEKSAWMLRMQSAQ